MQGKMKMCGLHHPKKSRNIAKMKKYRLYHPEKVQNSGASNSGLAELQIFKN